MLDEPRRRRGRAVRLQVPAAGAGGFPEGHPDGAGAAHRRRGHPGAGVSRGRQESPMAAHEGPGSVQEPPNTAKGGQVTRGLHFCSPKPSYQGSCARGCASSARGCFRELPRARLGFGGPARPLPLPPGKPDRVGCADHTWGCSKRKGQVIGRHLPAFPHRITQVTADKYSNKKPSQDRFMAIYEVRMKAGGDFRSGARGDREGSRNRDPSDRGQVHPRGVLRGSRGRCCSGQGAPRPKAGAEAAAGLSGHGPRGGLLQGAPRLQRRERGLLREVRLPAVREADAPRRARGGPAGPERRWPTLKAALAAGAAPSAAAPSRRWASVSATRGARARVRVRAAARGRPSPLGGQKVRGWLVRTARVLPVELLFCRAIPCLQTSGVPRHLQCLPPRWTASSRWPSRSEPGQAPSLVALFSFSPPCLDSSPVHLAVY
ncbi:unnamed protein product [Prorocentrum cordatum]|uniref:Uncharacterized protein n=1 Tax=Prorocentrum cordatum TaxID=2364126 RepID=A0ABN9QFV6_9DINO|nr:unnamed protein product [Polarella glacialis]